MNQAIRKLSGLLVLPVLLAALLLLPVRANAVEYACTAELPVSVTLNGNNAEKFHITIECAEDADPDQPMPAEAEEGLWVTGDQKVSFTGFCYTEPGDYKYIVRQEKAGTDYMTYDDTVYTVVIQVTNLETEDGTTLQAKVYANTDDNPDEKVAELSFLNTYAPPTPKPDDHPDIAEAIENGTWGQPTPTPAAGVIPQTSDSLPLIGLVVILVVAAAAIVVLVVLRRRSHREEKN